MVKDITANAVICHKLYNAVSVFDRAFGMIGRDFTDFDGMLFRRCSAIHMLFMKIPLDIVFLDHSDTVVKVVENARPWQFCISAAHAKSALELPAGTIAKNGIKPGNRLQIAH